MSLPGQRCVNDGIYTSLESTEINFFPILPDCELARDSQTCTSGRFLFYCKTCKVLKHCSDETDRRVQQWLRNNCKHEVCV